VNLTDEDAIPIYMRISDKVLHLRRLGMTYTNIAERLGINPWMAKKAARWGNIRVRAAHAFAPSGNQAPYLPLR